jgi:hypothetical protein
VIEPNNPEIDVDALMAEIRGDVMRARTAASAPLLAAADLEGSSGVWNGVEDQLRVAAQHAAVGIEVPAFARYVGLKRHLARALARVVLFLTQLTAQPQRIYNTSSLMALRLIVERVQALETEVAALRARLAPGPRAARPDRES